jgi:hypothetical protein
MKRVLPSFIALCLLLLQACGGANHWEGLSETLSVAGFGNSVTEIYVCGATGDDLTGDGSQAAPFQTIQRGIDEAVALGLGEVRVAQGTYNESLTLIEGISLYGGYESAGWTRDTLAHITTIDGGAASAIIANTPPVTTATVVDGFTLQTSSGTAGAVTITGTSPTISNNIISGASYGIIFNAGSSALVSYNTIHSNDIALSCSNSSDTIEHNMILLPTHTGINCSSFNGTISYNTINTDTRGINCDTNTAGSIEGNTINAHTGIHLEGNSTSKVTYNTIHAIDCGIYCMFSNVIMTYNTITADNTTGSSTGIYCEDSTSSISYNTITVNASNTQIARGIYCIVNNPEISYNTIKCNAGNYTYGVDIEGGTPEVYGNLIRVSSSQTGNGICTESSDTRIYNNVIISEAPITNWRGINCMNGPSNPRIFNNTIEGSAPTNESYGIMITTSHPYISNNIIRGGGGTTQIGIFENNIPADPIELRNNNIFDCNVSLYRDQDGAGDLTNIDDLNNSALTTQGAPALSDGNVSVPLTFGPELQITGTFPPEVINGGLNGIVQGWLFDWGFNDLRQQINRTEPWSMGAYEY